MKKHSVIWLIAVIACDESAAPSWNTAEISPSARVFSPTVNGTAQNGGQGFGDRLGPMAPWADSASPLNAPIKSGAKSQVLDAGASQGPEIVVGSMAVFVEGSTGATVATNLESKAEVWRLTSGAFQPGLLFSDGTALCGCGKQSPNNYSSSTLQCVVLATGAPMWAKTVPRWLTPTPGQGYGLPAQFVIRDGTLFVIGGDEVNAYALADGTELWHQSATALHRGLVFVGSELVIESAGANCLAGATCLRALNPANGDTVAEYAGAASFLWSSSGTAYFLAGAGAARKGVKYDATARTFSEDAALGTAVMSSLMVGLHRSAVVGGVTEALPSGKVLIIGTPETGRGRPVLCRFAIATQKMDWCQELTFPPDQLRAHPNVIFLAKGALTATLLSEPTSSHGVDDFRFYFGSWGFNFGDVYAYR